MDSSRPGPSSLWTAMHEPIVSRTSCSRSGGSSVGTSSFTCLSVSAFVFRLFVASSSLWSSWLRGSRSSPLVFLPPHSEGECLLRRVLRGLHGFVVQDHRRSSFCLRIRRVSVCYVVVFVVFVASWFKIIAARLSASRIRRVSVCYVVVFVVFVASWFKIIAARFSASAFGG